MEIVVRSDVIHIGRSWEDGEPIEGLYFYILARDAAGNQWVHPRGLANSELRWDKEYGIDYVERFEGVEQRQERLAQRIRDHLAAGGKLDFDQWEEIDPAYGSEAYAALAPTGYFRAAEIKMAEDRGEIAVGSVPYF